MTEISNATAERLPRYYRLLRELINRDVLRISSSELAVLTGLTASQIRQDMSGMGELGHKGYGYSTRQLYTVISRLLGVGAKLTAVMIGAGLTGQLVASSRILTQRGITLTAVFDGSGKYEGTQLAGLTVRHAHELAAALPELKPDVAILAMPESETDEMAAQLYKYGVPGIWNLTEKELHSNEITTVKNACLSDSLMNLCFLIRNNNE